MNSFVENLRKKLKCRSQAFEAHPGIVLDSWNMIRENQFLLPNKNFTKCFPALKVTFINVKLITAPSPQETISSPAESKKKRLLMRIKFPLKLLIWKPFRVNLEFIEIDLSCINLESIQKQSRLDRKIKKIQHCWGKPIKRTLCVTVRMIPVRYVSFFFRDVHLVLFHQHQLALVSLDS